MVKKQFLGFAIVVCVCAMATPTMAKQFLIDFAANGPNSAGAAVGWDGIDNLVQDVSTGPLTDLSGTDNDVIMTALDDSFDPNNTAPPGTSAMYDGFFVPIEARDDYLFKTDDTAGTSARLRFDNLDAGDYRVTLFEGRTSDASQFATLWVGDALGSLEPGSQNTGNFAGTSQTLNLTVGAGDTLWYRHLEDGSGGLSGIIINPVVVPEPTALSLLGLGSLLFCSIRRRS